ncbi:glycosyltransferase family 4 protein [Haloarcula sp. CGMCC 1.6347]|uniref:glycosyltransferase family 4 protein n=1 Tax=Haloarcula sp. CGMCC 1.6347 TaxID=3111455 RepID=UPI00300E82E2
MKILVLSREFPPYVLGGISYHLRSLYNEIVNKGHEVTVLTGKCPQSWDSAGDTVSNTINTESIQFGLREGYYVLYPLALRKYLISYDTTRFDVAITHTPLPYKISNIPMITKYHDCIAETRQYMRSNLSLSEKVGDSILHPLRTYINQKSLSKTRHAIFNSEINRKGWVENYRYDGSYSVIHNGVDTSTFYPEENNDHKDYVLFVGTSEQKGLTSVIEYANREHRPVHVVGDIQINHSNIVCHGRVSQEELRKIYSGAVTTIHPAKFESFGNAVLESLACGTPVITTPFCGASEIITPETGVVTEDIKSGVEKSITFDSKDCISVAHKYTWNFVADRTIKAVQNVI